MPGGHSQSGEREAWKAEPGASPWRVACDKHDTISHWRGAGAGRTGLTRNQVILYRIRGFESLPLRQNKRTCLYGGFLFWVDWIRIPGN